MGQINKNTEETKEKCISEHAQLWKLSTHTPRPRGGDIPLRPTPSTNKLGHWSSLSVSQLSAGPVPGPEPAA